MSHTIRIIGLLTIVSVFSASCATATRVTFDSGPQGAEVYLDNERIGETPVTVRVSNGVWEDPDVILRKEGYREIRTGIDKEVKVGNLISGLLLIWPAFLWVWGPEAYQYYDLIEE